MPILIRRGTDAQRTLVTFLDGEVIWATDTQEFWIGDGVTPGGIYIGGAAGFVPSTRNITINGVTWDLSADRTWTVGTVTSIGLVTPAEITVAGSPVTTSGNITLTWANQTNNLVFAGPAVAPAGVPTFRALVAADIPSLSSIYQPLDSDLTDIAALAPANDDIIQRKAGAWTNRTIAQYYADLQSSVMDDLCMYSIVASGGFALGTGTGAQSAFDTPGDVWTLAANTTYEFEWIIRITKSGTTCTLSAGFALGGGGSVTSVIINAIGGSGASGNAGVIWGYVNIGGGQVTVTSATNALVTLKGLIRMNVGGTVTPQITFSASPTSPVMAAGSHIKFTKWNSDVTNTRGTVA